MSTIIATTDFSRTAANAAAYACALARDCQASVLLLHAYYIPLSFSDAPMPMMPPEDARKAAEQQIRELQARLQESFPEVAVQSKLAYGDLLDILPEECTQPHTLVVMGNDAGTQEEWYGSELLAALRNLSIPVLGVPSEYRYEPLSRFCLACDPAHLEQDRPAAALRALPFVPQPLDLLCIRKPSGDPVADEQKIRSLLGDLDIRYHVEESEEVATAIGAFLEAHPAQCLMLMPHKYSILESLFHRSRTRSILSQVRIPVLALHGQG